MEEVVWENSSSMVPLITSPSWGSGFLSSQLPVAVTFHEGPSPKNVQAGPQHSPNMGKFIQGIIDREDLNAGNESKQSSNPVESNNSRGFAESNRANLMVGNLLPAIGCTTALRFSQCEDAIKFAADSALAMSGSGTNWVRALSTELPASPTLDTANTTEDQTDPNLGRRDHACSNKNDTITPCLRGGNSSAFGGLPFAYDFENLTTGESPTDFSTLGTESMESLDCLLSITKSNKHTTIQEDDDDNDGGISAERMEIGNMQKSVILATSMASERQPMVLNARSVSSAGSSDSPEAAMLYRNRAAQAPVDIRFGCDREESVSQGSSHPGQSKALVLDAGCSSKTRKRRFRDKIEFPTAHKRPLKDNMITDKKQLYVQRSLHFGPADSCTEPDAEAIACMREMIYRAAAFRPINLGMEVLERPKRKNVRISSDPQTVAARQRRERISDRIRILQRLVPGGTKMDTASMLDEAVNYLKFLKTQVNALQSHGNKQQLPLIPSHHLESLPTSSCGPWFPVLSTPSNYSHLCNSYSFPADPRLASAHGH